MWPSLAKHAVELLVPHIAPAVSSVFNRQPAETETSRTSVEQMAQGLRGDLGQVTASNADLYRQLQEQTDRLSGIALDVQAIRLLSVAVEDRLAVLERRSSARQRLGVGMGVAVLFLLSACIVLLLVLLFHHG